VADVDDNLDGKLQQSLARAFPLNPLLLGKITRGDAIEFRQIPVKLVQLR